MTKLDDALDRISQDIAQTGALTSEASRRYEEMFAVFRAELEDALDTCPSMEDAAKTTFAMVEGAANALQSSFPNPHPRACRDQCSACCHLFVSTPPGVARLIAQHIRETFDADAQATLLDRIKTAAAEIEQASSTTEVRVRCPLLGDDERCTIYEVRPLSCRAFTSSDASLCHAMVFGDEQQQKTRIDQDAGHYRLHIEATDALQQLAAKRNLDPRQRGFVHGLLDHLTKE